MPSGKNFTDDKRNSATTKHPVLTKFNKTMVLSTIPLDQSKIVFQQSTFGSSRLNHVLSSDRPIPPQTNQFSASVSSLQTFGHFQGKGAAKFPAIVESNVNTTAMPASSQSIPLSVVSGAHSQSNPHLSNLSNHQHSISKITANGAMQQQQPTPSKYVIFQQNGNVRYTTNEAFVASSNQANGVGNIVIVATEPMELTNPENLAGGFIHTANGSLIQASPNIASSADEDLTSLTWLQDKNLIKEIVARNSNETSSVIAQAHFATKNICSKNFSEDLREEIVNEGHIELSKQESNNIQSFKNDSVIQKSEFAHGNNKVSVNRQQNFSPANAIQSQNVIASTASSSQLPYEHINSTALQNIGGTATLHVGPSGTTTVVEYKTKPSCISINSSHFANEINLATKSSNVIASASAATKARATSLSNFRLTNFNFQATSIPASLESKNQQKNQTDCNTILTQKSFPTPTATHHPHKKYLREQMIVLEQEKSNSCDTLSVLNSQVIGSKDKFVSDREKITDNFSDTKHLPTNISATAPNNYAVEINSSFKQNTSESNSVLRAENALPYHGNLITISNARNSGTKPCGLDLMKELEMNGTECSLKNSNSPKLNAEENKTAANMSTKEQNGNLSAAPSPSKQQKHSISVPYDPKAHANAKPPYSFSSLIFMAIEDSSEKALPVKEIYAWIVQHFPYFKTAPTGWKNSVRHNLSLNKSFLKVEKAPNMGKGSLWRVEQHQRPNLIQALTRSPFYPCPSVERISQKSQNLASVASPDPSYNLNSFDNSNLASPSKSNLDAKLFPKLSKFMKEMKNVRNETSSPLIENNLGFVDSLEQSECQSDISSYSQNGSSNNSITEEFFPTNGNSTATFESVVKLVRDCGADSIEDVNAATAMLALKHGSKVFDEKFSNGTPVITNSPSADHTYSAGNSSGTSSLSVGNCTNAYNGNDMVASKSISDNLSTCASSDAAYESSDESHSLTPAELEHQRRVEGVDALLSLSSVCSSSPKPSLKRSAAELTDERVCYMENIPHLSGKGTLGVNGSSLDEGYNTQSYYSQMSSLSGGGTTANATLNLTTIPPSSPSFYPKKLKSSRLRAKIRQIKRKTTSLR